MKDRRLHFASVTLTLVLFCAFTVASHAQQGFQLIHTFTGLPDGATPTYVMQGANGNFYGTTAKGGANGYGVIFEIDSAGAESILYSFQGGADGADPQGIVQDSLGNFWGTTQSGGAYGFGVLFKMAEDGYAVRHSFAGYPGDGASPAGPPLLASDGNLYGITSQGGIFSCGSSAGCGVVFAFNTFAGYEGIVHNFAGWPTDGSNPAYLILDGKGNFLGTTYQGGTTNCANDTPGCGTVFKVSSSGDETILHSFTGPDGDEPTGILQAGGNIYGTTLMGGLGGGNIYVLSSTGQLTDLYNFKQGTGENPFGPLVRSQAGDIVGTTEVGPGPECFGSGCGEIFVLTPQNKLETLFAFPTSMVDGDYPLGINATKSGTLFGVTLLGGADNDGVFYEYVP